MEKEYCDIELPKTLEELLYDWESCARYWKRECKEFADLYVKYKNAFDSADERVDKARGVIERLEERIQELQVENDNLSQAMMASAEATRNEGSDNNAD